jgi:hypothetical protein
MSVHRPESLEELVTYIKRQLGEDSADGATVEVDVTENQFQDKIYQAIDLWQEFAYDGQRMKIFIVPKESFESGDGTVTLPSEVMAVVGYVEVGGTGNRDQMFAFDYQYMQTFAADYMAGGNILSLDLTRSYVKLLKQKFTKTNDLRFNGTTKEITMLNTELVGDAVAVIAYVYISEDDYGNVYNHIWIKRYVEAACRKQWGQNLLMFTDVRLPGSIGINAQYLFDSGKEEMEKLEEELKGTWQRPPKFIVR